MELSSRVRRRLPPSEFGLSAERKYPVNDRHHAVNAKARATQQVGKSITREQKEEIDEKANAVLRRSSARAKA